MFKELFTSGRATRVPASDQPVADNPHVEQVILPDGQVLMVARGNLAAAKAVLAARKAALRRMEEQRQAERVIVFPQHDAKRVRRAS